MDNTDGRQSEDEPEPEPEPDDDKDPVVEPASPGRRATWRLKAFVNSMYRDPNFPWPYVEWRRKTLKDENKTQVTDVGDDENRMAALALAGICDLTYDHADGSFKYRPTDPTSHRLRRRSPNCRGAASPTCPKRIGRRWFSALFSWDRRRRRN